MAKKEKDQTITLDDKTYKLSDLNQEQLNMVNHIQDLDRKIASAQFNLDQLIFGKNAFVDTLRASLTIQNDGTEH